MLTACPEKYSYMMSELIRAARFVRRPAPLVQYFRRHLHKPTSGCCVLIQNQIPTSARRNRKRGLPFGSYSLHNVPAVRAISFARVLPKLAVKLVRIPAMLGGVVITGVAYVQYQATRESLDKSKAAKN